MKNDDRRNDDFGFGIVAYKSRPNRCFECGVMTRGMHHVVPKVYGGTKQIPLCEECQNKAQDCKTIFPAMVKEGLARAKAKGVKFGAPIKLSSEAAAQILELRKEGKSIRETARMVGLSVGTVHKVVADPERNEFFTKTMTFR